MFAVIDVHLSLLLVNMPFSFLRNVASACKSVVVWKYGTMDKEWDMLLIN